MIRESLSGLNVVDFTWIGAGPTCSMLLGDLGADVVKVEPPDGDHGRRLGPPWVNGDTSAVYAGFNRNKRSICLDLKSTAGFNVAMRLASRADVVLESFRPGVADRLGLGYDAVRAQNPRVVYGSVSAYGATGEYASRAGVDGILQAASGLMMLMGEAGQAPGKVQTPIVDIATGYMATVGVLAQLMERERTGNGGYLDISLFGTAVALQQPSLTGYLGDGDQPLRTGSAAPYSAPNEAFAARDGWIMVAAYLGDQWQRLCKLLDRQELIDDPRFATSSLRVKHRPAMRDELNRTFGTRDCAFWLDALVANDILCSKVCGYDDLMENPALAHLQLIAEMRDGAGRRFRTPGLPLNSRESQSRAHRAPPDLGEHTEAILAELGYDPREASALLQSGAARGRRMQGASV
ncbi:carnitine dehydratase [Pandoraea captiosa]|jgi:crotonobetainyl-CoA:carnitine CoA-transferase CaiB-like acyl-CoA transferase|uniref:Carnitine dehydratase n=1 Tax=Pandoraea captiosa TaxID=2508302 RepID=A0A5E4ZLN1_9BURK|nr:CoA transferase [Pandoraea captiosa]VVE61265.1 carnitine dehydratase [Pandoraea captiosa]